MKIDFYSLKKSYGAQTTAISGWVHFGLFLLITPWNKSVCSNGGLLPILIVFSFFAFFFLLPVPFYLLDWLLKLRVKKQFLLENKFYDFFFDLGLVLYLLPFVWFLEMCKFKIWPFLVLFSIFVAIRILKLKYPEGVKKPL